MSLKTKFVINRVAKVVKGGSFSILPLFVVATDMMGRIGKACSEVHCYLERRGAGEKHLVNVSRKALTIPPRCMGCSVRSMCS